MNGQIVTDPFPGNIIPQNRIDPVAAKIQALIPLPTTSALTNNWAQTAGNYKRQMIPAFKIDEILPDNSKVAFYFSEQTTDQLTSPDALPDPLTGVRVQAIYGTTARVNYDRSLTPAVLLHVGAGIQRFHNPDSSPASEFFNVFNRTYLANPSLTAPTQPQARNSQGVPTSGWGYINSTWLYSQPRNGQLVARFTS